MAHAGLTPRPRTRGQLHDPMTAVMAEGSRATRITPSAAARSQTISSTGPARRPARGDRLASRVRHRGEPGEPPTRSANHSDRNVQLTHRDSLGTVGRGAIEKCLRTGLRLDRRYGGTPTVRVRGHESERRDKPMIAMITALVSSRGADHI